MELVVPTGMFLVLEGEPLRRLDGDGGVLPLIGADPPGQRPDGVLGVPGGVVPAFEGGDARAHGWPLTG